MISGTLPENYENVSFAENFAFALNEGSQVLFVTLDRYMPVRKNQIRSFYWILVSNSSIAAFLKNLLKTNDKRYINNH